MFLHVIPVLSPTHRPPPGLLPPSFDTLDRSWLPLVDPAGASLGHVAVFDPLVAADPEHAGYALGRAAPEGMAVIRSGPEVVEGPGVAWMPEARVRFEAFAAGFERAVAPRLGVSYPAIWPHAHGAVSDAPSLQAFIRGRQDRGWRFVLDPAGLLTPSMMPLVHDHLRRLLDLIGDHPAACLLIEDEATRHAWPAGWQGREGGETGSTVPRLRRPATGGRDSYTLAP